MQKPDFYQSFFIQGRSGMQSCNDADGKHRMPVVVKTIDSRGQISFGKQHAGRTVTVDEVEDGVWLVRVAPVIPKSELWLHRLSVADKLKRAIQCGENTSSK